MKLARALVLALAGATLAGCASAPPPKRSVADEDPWINGVRQRPLSEEEVDATIKKNRERVVGCYRRERLNNDGKLSDYVFRLEIPADGKAPKVSAVSATVAGQRALELCLSDTLAALRFPPHAGAKLVLNVPIAGPSS
jgi:hypothetical protein